MYWYYTHTFYLSKNDIGNISVSEVTLLFTRAKFIKHSSFVILCLTRCIRHNITTVT